VRYFVIASDGQRYGPADVQTLNQWAAEGRVLPTSMLEEVQTLQRLPASSVLVFGSAPPSEPQTYAAPPNYANYPRANNFDDGSKEMQTAWICGVLGLFCCGIILGAVGLSNALTAKKKGHPSSQGAIVLNSIAIVISVGLLILRFAGIFNVF